ncbi:MAG: translocation/assembly module TamB domain-containing protein [Parachlamydiales bacterium]
MKKKRHTIIYYITVWILIIFFTAISTAMISFQTNAGKNKIKAIITQYFKKQKIDIKIDKINGILPFQYDLKNVSIEYDNNTIAIEKLEFRIKILPLLRNKLEFKTFQADTINFYALLNTQLDSLTKDNVQEIPKEKNIWISPPFKITFDKLQLKRLNIKAFDSIIALNISGDAKIAKSGNKISSNLRISREGYEKSNLNISLKADKLTKLVQLKSNGYILSTKIFEPFYQNDFNLSFDFAIETKVSLINYLSSVKEKISLPKILGKATGNLYKIENEKLKKPIFLFDKKSMYFFNFSNHDDLRINISNAYLKNDIFQLYLDALINNDLNLEKSNLTFRINDFKKLKNSDLLGSLIINSSLEKEKFLTKFNFKNFSFKKIPFTEFDGTIDGSYLNKVFNGNLTSSFFAFDQKFAVSSALKLENSIMDISKLDINSPSSKLSADLSITPDLLIKGSGKAHFNDFLQIQKFYPNTAFNGIADIAFEFKQKPEENFIQNLTLEIDATDLTLKNIYSASSKSFISIDNPFSDITFEIKLNFNDIIFHELSLKNLSFETSTKDQNWPYKLYLQGELKSPLEIETSGFFRINKKEFVLNMQDIHGFLFTHNFISPKPIIMEISEDKFLLTDLSIELFDSSISADIDFTNKKSKAKVNLKHFPLDFLSINPLDLDITGFVSLNFELEKDKEIKSSLLADLESLTITSLGDELPLTASGKLNSNIKNNYFNFESDLKIRNYELISLTGKIPLKFDLVKLNVKPDDSKKLNLDIKYNGKVDEVLDFVNIGPQRLEGDLESQIHLSNKLKDLKIKGFCNYKNGYYENYYTGTLIKDISANFIMKNEKITLEYLNGNDTMQGKLSASGIFSISEKDHFPFTFKTQISDFQCVDSNIIAAKATANLSITGNRFSSAATGSVKINNMTMTIPEKFPISIPTLNPIFITNQYQEIPKEAKPETAIYPIHLNFDIDATSPISITGRGLSSSWMGYFKIGGTYMNFQTIGSLDLIKGDYRFSSKHFVLTKGNLNFSGQPNEMPILNVQAKLNQQGVDILANMQGPLDSPKLFFTSEPPLPASSIMSLLVFGQELSVLSESQKIDLVARMTQNLDTSSAAHAEDISSLGLDRIDVADTNAAEQAGLKFGKYITNGVVVSFSQGEDQGSSNIIVEVDLKRGFIFQAETQQQEEQGKFSLKWRRNY